uniref:Uncharacterized protein n=1 Tax=Cucumis melo TaxID=3656 RepID=A0A9I9E3V1_CUCME
MLGSETGSGRLEPGRVERLSRFRGFFSFRRTTALPPCSVGVGDTS